MLASNLNPITSYIIIVKLAGSIIIAASRLIHGQKIIQENNNLFLGHTHKMSRKYRNTIMNIVHSHWKVQIRLVLLQTVSRLSDVDASLSE